MIRIRRHTARRPFRLATSASGLATFPDDRDLVLLASGFGDEQPGSGLYACSPTGVDRLDDLASTGLCLDPESGGLVRVLHGPHPPNAPAEFLKYTQSGFSYFRIDEVQDPHGIAVDDQGRLLAVSTFTNEVVWLNGDGSIDLRWSLDGEPDSWHLNNLFLDGDEVYVSALGGTLRNREYSTHLMSDRGVVFEVPSGRRVLEGISSPHNPVRVSDRWIVCESGPMRLVELEPGSTPVRVKSVQLAGWTRGLAMTADRIFVGESAHRILSASGTASVAVLDRATFTLIDRWQLPCAEIFDLLIVPRTLVDVVSETTNEVAALIEKKAIQRWWRDPDPEGSVALDPVDRRIRVEAEIPEKVGAGALIVIDCVAHNEGSRPLPHVGESQVRLSYRWSRTEPDGSKSTLTDSAAFRTPLGEPLRPGESARRRILVRCPEEEGDYGLTLGAVQDEEHWLDPNDSDLTFAQVRVLDVVTFSGAVH